MRRPAIVFLLLGVLIGGRDVSARTVVNPYPGYDSAIYADPAHWLCRPDVDDVCDHDLDATVVRAKRADTRLQRGDESPIQVHRPRLVRSGRYACDYPVPRGYL